MIKDENNVVSLIFGKQYLALSSWERTSTSEGPRSKVSCSKLLIVALQNRWSVWLFCNDHFGMYKLHGNTAFLLNYWSALVLIEGKLNFDWHQNRLCWIGQLSRLCQDAPINSISSLFLASRSVHCDIHDSLIKYGWTVSILGLPTSLRSFNFDLNSEVAYFRTTARLSRFFCFLWRFWHSINLLSSMEFQVFSSFSFWKQFLCQGSACLHLDAYTI